MTKTKRVLAVILSLTLVLSMSTFAFAADSTSTGSGSTSTGSGSASTGSGSTSTGNVTTTKISADKVTVNGVEYEVTLAEITAQVEEEVSSPEKIEALLKDQYIAGATVETLGAQEVTIPNLSAEELAKGVTITFNVSSAKSGDVIKILHKRSSDGVWEVLNTTVTDGTVSAVFTSLSPVVIVRMTGGNAATGVVSNANGSASDSTTVTGTSSAVTSPKTGINAFVYVAEFIALVSFAGIVIVSRKRAL